MPPRNSDDSSDDFLANPDFLGTKDFLNWEKTAQQKEIDVAMDRIYDEAKSGKLYAKLIASSVHPKVRLKKRDPIAPAANIVSPPAQLLDRIARFLYPKRTYENVFLQVISDIRFEYFEALNDGDERKARWVALRGYLIFGFTALIHIATLVTETFNKLRQKS